MKTAFVITTINKPNNIMKLYAKMCKEKEIDYYIIGDQKSDERLALNTKIKFFMINKKNNIKKTLHKIKILSI